MAVAAGEAPVADEGVMLFGKPVGSLGTRDRRRLGLRYVPEQRLGHAAVPEISLLRTATETFSMPHTRSEPG